MCMICVEYQAKRLSTGDAFRNLGEVIDGTTDDHLVEILKTIFDSPGAKLDPDGETLHLNGQVKLNIKSIRLTYGRGN